MRISTGMSDGRRESGVSHGGNNECKVYVGNLPSDVRSRDLEDIFYKYGRIVEVDLHNRRGPPFAFIEFEDPRDAEDAVRGRDGYVLDGYKLRVEFPRSSSRGPPNRGRGASGGNFRGGRGGYRPRGYQLIISGLPPSGSWQDIKDHFREAGDVVYADSYKDGTGVVEFSNYEHAKRALRDLDDSKFRSHEGETAYIRVREAKSSKSPSPRHSPKYRSASSRSHSKSRSRSRSRSNPRYVD